MATGECLPHSIVVASHIFQHKWRGELSRFTSLENINDPRNGLLLYKPVEWAFDRAKICVEVKSQTEMTFRLLDQDLHGIKLVNKACELRAGKGRGNQPLPEESGIQMTFGDLDRQPLKFPEEVQFRPSKRLLGLHALVSRWTAQRYTHHRIPSVSYDTSDDARAKTALQHLKVMAWRDSVHCDAPVSISRPLGRVILTCSH
jgi:hypothetical protein